MRVYADSSALLKRAVAEPESEALDIELADYVAQEALVLASSLAWVEVSRALLNHPGKLATDEVQEAFDLALSGVAERPMADDVLALARRIGPTSLRTLDAIHLATAMLLDVEVVLCYDDRLTAACEHHGLATKAPGRDR